MLTVYRVFMDVDRFQCFMTDDKVFFERYKFDGESYAEEWKPAEIYIYKPKKKVPDFWAFSGTLGFAVTRELYMDSAKAEAGQTRAVLFLLDAGADPSGDGPDEVSPLFGAANNFDVDMVLALLARGADPNARDDTSRTPIFRVAQYHEPAAAEMIRILAEHGADLTAQNGQGQTPLEFAKKERNPLSVAALEAAAKAVKKK